MRFRLLSDLHLEFEDRTEDYTPIPLDDDAETVLILAGDIGVGLGAVEFLQRMCDRFYQVVYILGNHEYYNNEANKLLKRWDAFADTEAPDNFIYLNDDWRLIADPNDPKAPKTRIVGGTLWTDFDGGDYFAMNAAQQGMNDFNCVKIKEGPSAGGGYRKRRWLPADAIRAHKKTLFTITETVRVPHDGPTVVVTHHLPHPLCIGAQFKGDRLNSAYMSNLDEHIEKYDIDVWCHGHTHDNVDVEVHGTRILCNPRGYVGHELNKGFNEQLTFEV